MKIRTVDYREGLLVRLQDNQYAAEYLTEVLKNESQECFLIAVKNVIDAMKLNKSSISKKAGVTRQAVYHSLSKNGNPRLSTLNKILNVIGFEISVVRKKARKKAA